MGIPRNIVLILPNISLTWHTAGPSRAAGLSKLSGIFVFGQKCKQIQFNHFTEMSHQHILKILPLSIFLRVAWSRHDAEFLA